MNTELWGQGEITEEHSGESRGRRIQQTLEVTLWVFSMLWLVAILGVIVEFVRPPGDPLRASDWQIDAGPIETFQIGVPQRLDREAEPVSVVRLGGDHFTSVAAVCPHQRCVLVWDSSLHLYICPCHGETWDLEGRLTSGGTDRPLQSYFVHLKDGRVRVHLLRPAEGEV